MLPFSGATGLFVLPPRGKSKELVTVRLSNLPAPIEVPAETVTSELITSSPDKEFRLPLVVCAIETVFPMPCLECKKP